MNKKNSLEDMEKDINAFMKKNALLFGVENKIEKQAVSKEKGLKNFAGGPARKTSAKNTKITTTDLGEIYEEKYGIFSVPASNPNNKEVVSVVNDLLDMYFNEKDLRKRIVNGAQAIVRNPILRGDYGENTEKAIENKGFDRLMIDTGQFFNSIIADIGE